MGNPKKLHASVITVAMAMAVLIMIAIIAIFGARRLHLIKKSDGILAFEQTTNYDTSKSPKSVTVNKVTNSKPSVVINLGNDPLEYKLSVNSFSVHQNTVNVGLTQSYGDLMLENPANTSVTIKDKDPLKDGKYKLIVNISKQYASPHADAASSGTLLTNFDVK